MFDVGLVYCGDGVYCYGEDGNCLQYWVLLIVQWWQCDIDYLEQCIECCDFGGGCYEFGDWGGCVLVYIGNLGVEWYCVDFEQQVDCEQCDVG